MKLCSLKMLHLYFYYHSFLCSSEAQTEQIQRRCRETNHRKLYSKAKNTTVQKCMVNRGWCTVWFNIIMRYVTSWAPTVQMLEIFFSLNAKNNDQSGCLSLACIHKLTGQWTLNQCFPSQRSVSKQDYKLSETCQFWSTFTESTRFACSSKVQPVHP